MAKSATTPANAPTGAPTSGFAPIDLEAMRNTPRPPPNAARQAKLGSSCVTPHGSCSLLYPLQPDSACICVNGYTSVAGRAK